MWTNSRLGVNEVNKLYEAGGFGSVFLYKGKDVLPGVAGHGVFRVSGLFFLDIIYKG